MADLPIDDPKAAPSEAALVEPAPEVIEAPAPRERPSIDVDSMARTFNLHDRIFSSSRGSGLSLREDGTIAILKDQLAALVAAEAFRQRQTANAAEIEALRQAIRDLGAEPKA